MTLYKTFLATTSTSHAKQPEDMQEEIMHLKKVSRDIFS